MEEVFQATYAFEQFVLEYAQYHLNKTTPNLSINSQEIGKGKKKKKNQNRRLDLSKETTLPLRNIFFSRPR